MMKGLIFFGLVFFVNFSVHSMDVYCNGAPTTIQENGGGNVALTAIVDPAVFVGVNASVCEYATVLGSAKINDQARVYGYASISDGTIVSGNAEIFGNAILRSNPLSQVVSVMDNAKVYGNAKVLEGATVKSSAKVFENARVSGNATIDESAQVYGNSTVTATAKILGTSKIHGTAVIAREVVSVSGASNICVNRYYPANTVLSDVINCPNLFIKNRKSWRKNEK